MIVTAASLGAAFVAGISTSVGPCAAPRYLALIGSLQSCRSRDRAVAIGTFAGGLATSYAACAFVAGVLGFVLMHSREMFAALAIAFCTSGILTMVARDGCAHHATGTQPSRGFLSGFASGLVVSPCCAPFVAGTGILAAASGSAIDAAAALAAFLFGHVAPVLIAGGSSLAVPAGIRSATLRGAMATIGGTCSIALGLYYGLTA